MNILDNLITGFSVERLVQFFRQKISSFKPDEENYETLFLDNENIIGDYKDILKIGEADLKNSEDLIIIAARTLKKLTDKTGKKRQSTRSIEHDRKSCLVFWNVNWRNCV